MNRTSLTRHILYEYPKGVLNLVRAPIQGSSRLSYTFRFPRSQLTVRNQEAWKDSLQDRYRSVP